MLLAMFVIGGDASAAKHPDPSRRYIQGAGMAIEGLANDSEFKYGAGMRWLRAHSDVTEPARTANGFVHREKACYETLVAVHPSRRQDPPAQRRHAFHAATGHLTGGMVGLAVTTGMGADDSAVLGMYDRASHAFRQHDDAKALTELDALQKFPRTPENVALAAGIIRLGIAQIAEGRSLSSQDFDFLASLCSTAKRVSTPRFGAPTATTLADLNAKTPYSMALEFEYLRLLTQAMRKPDPDPVEIATIRQDVGFRIVTATRPTSWNERKLAKSIRLARPHFEANVAALQDDQSPMGTRLLLTSMGVVFWLDHGLESPTAEQQRARTRQEAERLLAVGMQRRAQSIQGYYSLLSWIHRVLQEDAQAMQHPALRAYHEECGTPSTHTSSAAAMTAMAHCSPDIVRFRGIGAPQAFDDQETLASVPERVFGDIMRSVRGSLDPSGGDNGAAPVHIDDEKELKALMLRGQYAQAEALALGLLAAGNADDPSLARVTAALGPLAAGKADDLSHARANAALGEIDIHRGRYASGIARAGRAQDMFDRMLPANHPDRTACRALLARGHAALNESSKATELYRSLIDPRPRNAIERISYSLQRGEAIPTAQLQLLDRIRSNEQALIALDAEALRNRIRLAGLPDTGGTDAAAPDYEALIARTRTLLGDDSPREALFHLQAALQAKADKDMTQALQSAATALAILQRNPPPDAAVSPTDPAWWHQPTRYVAEQAFLIVTDAAAPSGPTQLEQAFAALQLLHRNDDAPALHNVRARLAASASARADIREYEQLLGRVAVDADGPAHQDPAALQRLDALRSEIQAAHPAYFSLLADSVVDVGQLRSRLPDDTLYYQITPVGDVYYGIALTRQGGRVVRLASKHEVDAQAGTLLDSVHRWESARSTPFALAAAEALHGLLIAPVADETSTHGRIVLVAATNLAALPFAAIKTPGTTAGYLGLSHAIVSAPSASSWLGLASRAASDRTFVPFFGLGNPRIGALSISSGDFAQTSFVFRGAETTAAPDRHDAIRALPALPETADEIQAIARLLDHRGNTVLLGADATEAAVRSAAEHPYATLAFSTHGVALADGTGYEEPGLVMTPPPTVTRADDDGFLAASEVAGLQLSADLVLLAACSTDRTRPDALGSLGPLVRAFHFAGASQLLATRWKIDSRATVDLVTGFVRALRDRPERGSAHALKDAANALAADPEHGDPRFWAAFHVSGGI